jgi:hypothetical protein
VPKSGREQLRQSGGYSITSSAAQLEGVSPLLNKVRKGRGTESARSGQAADHCEEGFDRSLVESVTPS